MDVVAAVEPYRPNELEAVARLLLGDNRVRVIPGGWWSFYPERLEVVYPQNLLAEWPAHRSLGALCHEMAEVFYSGQEAITVFRDFAAMATTRGCPEQSALLLLNAINDLRVNRLYLRAFPGSRRYFQAVYRTVTLVPKDDLPAHAPVARELAHHAFLDAVTVRWAASLDRAHGSIERQPDTSDDTPSDPDERVRRAVSRCWPAISRAIDADDLVTLSNVVRDQVLAAYVELLEASNEEIRRAASADSAEELNDPPPQDEDAEGSEAEGLSEDDLKLLARSNPVDSGPAEAWVLLPGDEASADDEQDSGPAKPAPAAPAGETRPPSMGATPWTGGVVQKFRRIGRRSHSPTIYENFNYVEAVHRLQPQIDALLNGTSGQDGLIAILNRKRFGSIDPWRRPRRRRRADSGEIDSDHPENLLLAPSVAFLKGQRRARDDSQKDFAHTILFDVSGSVVQRGYRSRKFDQLVDTLVVFCEIHQRLKLPFEFIAFSDHFTVARGFDETHYDHLRIEPSSSYVVRDFSYLVREMYDLAHGETHEDPAFGRAIDDLNQQRGLKSIFVVTDGISSDRRVLTDRLLEIEQRNQFIPARERLMVLAFGLGLAETEFNASYQPEIDGQPIQCSVGRLVPNVDALPAIVCDAVDRRIRSA